MKPYHHIFSCLTILAITVSCNSKTNGSSTTQSETAVQETLSDNYALYSDFINNKDFKGIYDTGTIKVLVTDDAKVLPAETFSYYSYTGSYDGEYYETETYTEHECFIAYTGDEYMVFDETGREMIEHGITEYELYPYGSYIYGKSDQGWNVYSLDKYDSEWNDTTPLCKIYFEKCKITLDGALLLDSNGDVYLSRTDEGYMMFMNISEEERNSQQEEMIAQQRQQLMMLIFANIISANQNQINQMNNLYDSYNVSTRSEEAIKADIAKYKERINYCESHISDGTAEGMGYRNIIGNYKRMIQEREQELLYAR